MTCLRSNVAEELDNALGLNSMINFVLNSEFG